MRYKSVIGEITIRTMYLTLFLAFCSSITNADADLIRHWSMPSESSLVNVAIDSKNNVYAIDSKNNKITKFTPQGIPKLTWNTLGIGDGRVTTAQYIYVDKNNKIYVFGYGYKDIEVFNSEGKLLDKIPTQGIPQGELINNISVDPHETIYIVTSFEEGGNSGKSYFKKVNSSIFEPLNISNVSFIIDAESDNKGFLYILDKNCLCIKKYTNKHNYLRTIYTTDTSNRDISEKTPTMFSIGKDNKLYIIEDTYHYRDQSTSLSFLKTNNEGYYIGEENYYFYFPYPYDQGTRSGSAASAIIADKFGVVYLAGGNIRAYAFPPELDVTASSSTTINLSWTNTSSSESSFEIERCTPYKNSDSDLCTDSRLEYWETIASTGSNKTSFIDSNLEPSSTYHYRIRLVHDRKRSFFTSNHSSAKTLN